MSGIDPDGYHFHDIAGPVEGILSAFSEECTYCAAAALAIAAIDGYQQTGSYKGAALDAGEAYVMYEIGNHYPGTYTATDPQFWAKAALEGLAGGAFSQAGGGRFGDGFLGGFSGSIAGNYIDPGDGKFFDTAKAVIEAYIVGGTASALGGGSFRNGGAAAAFAELFNAAKHQIEKPDSANQNPTAKEIDEELDKLSKETRIPKRDLWALFMKESSLRQFGKDGQVLDNSGAYGIGQIRESTARLYAGDDAVALMKIDWKYNMELSAKIFAWGYDKSFNATITDDCVRAGRAYDIYNGKGGYPFIASQLIGNSDVYIYPEVSLYLKYYESYKP